MFGVCHRRAELPKAALRLCSLHQNFVTDVLSASPAVENVASADCACFEQAITSGTFLSSVVL